MIDLPPEVADFGNANTSFSGGALMSAGERDSLGTPGGGWGNGGSGSGGGGVNHTMLSLGGLDVTRLDRPSFGGLWNAGGGGGRSGGGEAGASSASYKNPAAAARALADLLTGSSGGGEEGMGGTAASACYRDGASWGIRACS